MELNLIGSLPYLVAFIAVCISIGGLFAYRQGFAQQSGEIQGRTIEALKTRVETLEGQQVEDKREILHQRRILDTVRTALKQRGLFIELNGEYVTLRDDVKHTTTTVYIKTTEDTTP